MDPLTDLKDLHLPPEPGLWPLAPGWWLLAAIACVAVVAGVFFILRWRRRNAYRRAALAALSRWRHDGEGLNALLALARRTALAGAPLSPLATLSGTALLARLDHQCRGELCAALGLRDTDALAALLYGSAEPALGDGQRQILYRALRRWIRQHRRADLC